MKGHLKDNIIEVLQDYKKVQSVNLKRDNFLLQENIPTRYKFSAINKLHGSDIVMYGLNVGITKKSIAKGQRLCNPICPAIKHTSNSVLFERMVDIIDPDAGSIIVGNDSIESKGVELLELIVNVARSKKFIKSENLDQNDFIPWKRKFITVEKNC